MTDLTTKKVMEIRDKFLKADREALAKLKRAKQVELDALRGWLKSKVKNND